MKAKINKIYILVDSIKSSISGRFTDTCNLFADADISTNYKKIPINVVSIYKNFLKTAKSITKIRDKHKSPFILIMEIYILKKYENQYFLMFLIFYGLLKNSKKRVFINGGL